MKHNAFRFLIILFFLPLVVKADDCSPVNLITELESPFAKIPVYDQKDSNICYAYSASQMLDYYLIKKGALKRSVHPAWLALNYARGKNREGLDIGHTKEAMERLSDVANCDYDTVSNALFSWARRSDIPDAKILAFIEKKSKRASKLFSEEHIQELKRSALSPVEFVARILSPACENARVKINVPKVSKRNFRDLPDDASFEFFLKKRLSESSFPISIAYCSTVWKRPDYDGIDLTFFGARDSLKKDCDYHESLVVGKKKTGGSCQFLVRNTWGNTWREGNRKWKCLCKNKFTNEFVDDCEAHTHPDDIYSIEACWISSDKLARNVGGITFMEQ